VAGDGEEGRGHSLPPKELGSGVSPSGIECVIGPSVVERIESEEDVSKVLTWHRALKRQFVLLLAKLECI
jgi:hypothetical protein